MYLLPAVASGPPLLDVIHHCDALTLLRALPDESVDVSFADPPYNNGTKYDEYHDNRADYELWCRAWFVELRRISKRVVITPGHGNMWMWGQIERPFGVGIWYKPGNPATSVIGWETWEPWLYWAKGNGVLGGPSDIKAAVSKQAHADNHPCPKPMQFMLGLLRKMAKPEQVILDPFCGTGTTLMAAQRLGMHYIGCEISAHYSQVARRNLALPYTLPMFA